MTNESANWHNQGDLDKIERLKKALEKYGQHKNECAYRQGLKGNTIEDCDCGFEQARKGDKVVRRLCLNTTKF